MLFCLTAQIVGLAILYNHYLAVHEILPDLAFLPCCYISNTTCFKLFISLSKLPLVAF